VPGPRDFAPTPLFTPNPYGLLTAIDPLPNPPKHWRNGVNYQPMCADIAGTYEECITITGSASGIGPPPPPAVLTNLVNAGVRGAFPFTISAEFDCSAVGNEEARAVAEQALTEMETQAVEQAFWSGIIPGQTQPTVFPHLAANVTVLDSVTTVSAITVQTAATVITGAGGIGSNAVEIVGALEKQLAQCYGGVGILHVTEDVLDTLAAYNLVIRNGSRLTTPNGNKIAAGAGYLGTGPDGSSPGAGRSWVYMTGNMWFVRGEVSFRGNTTESFNRQENTLSMIADRTYLLYWDCCHFAGLVAGLGAPKGN
jgi:hypothetical protein